MGRYGVKTVGLDKEPIRTTGGLRILPDMSLAALEPAHSAMLILPGGELWKEGLNADAAQKAQQFLAADVPVAAICAATTGLAWAGALDNRQHTGNARMELQATNYRGQAFYKDEPAISDGNLITAAAFAPVDFAYRIFQKLELYPPDILEAWYRLFKTGDPSQWRALMKEAS